MKIDKVVDFKKVKKACTHKMRKALDKCLRKNGYATKNGYRRRLDLLIRQKKASEPVRTYYWDLYFRHIKISSSPIEMSYDEANFKNIELKKNGKSYKIKPY